MREVRRQLDRFRLTNSSGRWTAQPDAQFGQPDLDRLTTFPFPRDFRFRQCALQRESCWLETVFREVVRRRGPTKIEFGGVLFRCAQDEIASGEEGLQFLNRVSWTMATEKFGRRRIGVFV